MTIECPKCQTNNPDTVKFCGECGTPLESEFDHTRTLETPTEELKRGSVFADRYEIIEELGKGGMGKVYRVEDTKIKEEVALKLIKPEIAADKKTIERFRNELKIARKIRHENVCAMFDLGEEKGRHYITMDYIPGQDLKGLIRQTGKLAVSTAISIAKHVCEGLTEAHKLGVVHRDLKPANIMIDKDGNVRIMDFGIARSLRAKGITDAGVMIGTPEYMSPEQAEAKDADHRSDLYSLGIILYEMVIGQLPFEGDTPLSIAMKHKEEPPKEPKMLNPQIPDDLSRIIIKSLAKDKADRYQSAEQLSQELNNIEKEIPVTPREMSEQKPLTSKELIVSFNLKKLFLPLLSLIAVIIVVVIILQLLPPKPEVPFKLGKHSIAVLPFENLSSQKNRQFLCEGMTDEIIIKLAGLQGWKVINRDSVMQFKNQDVDIKKIGLLLDVANVLSATVQVEGENLRVGAQLVNTEDLTIIWSDTFETKLDKMIDTQSNIATKIARALQTELTSAELDVLERKATENFKAYNLYLQGRYFWKKRTEEGLKLAVDYFKKAIHEDPNYALAYAGLASCYNLFSIYGSVPAEESFSKAKQAATKALEIDDSLAEAHTSLGYVKIRYDWDWVGAEQEYKMALRLNPNHATSHHWYAELLASDGRFEEAIAEVKRALELDPVSLIINTIMGYVYMWAQEYNLAISQLKKTIEMDPNFPMAHVGLGLVYEFSENFSAAITEFETAKDLSPASSMTLGYLGQAYARAGKKGKAIEIIRELQSRSQQGYVAPYWIAVIYEGLGEKDKAFELLQKAYEDRNEALIFLKVGPYYDGLRSDPRFSELMKKVGFKDL